MSVRSTISWPARLALDLKERRFAALQNIIWFLGPLLVAILKTTVQVDKSLGYQSMKELL